MSLRQAGTVLEFREQFEVLSAPLQHANDEILKATFLAGSKEGIRAELRVHCPDELGQMMKMAQRIEEKEVTFGQGATRYGGNGGGIGSVGSFAGRSALGNKNGPNSRNGPAAQTQINPTGSNNPTPNVSVGSINPSRSTQQEGGGTGSTGPSQTASGGVDGRQNSRSRRLTQEEYDDHWRRNLCFRCDAPYGPGHVCQHPQLQVMFLAEDDMQEYEDGGEAEPQNSEGPDTLQLSVQSVIGYTSNHSLKLWGKVGNQPVIVLIDTGATHNFIAEGVVNALDLKVDRSKHIP